MVADCKALVAIANSLEDDTTVGGDINWIGENQPAVFTMLMDTDWDGVTVGLVDDVGDLDDDDTTEVMRVTEVDLPDESLTGELADEWADLTALTTLDLSGNSLEGAVPRSVWAFFDGLELDLSGNPDLDPSPTLGLTAVVTKGDSGTDSRA